MAQREYPNITVNDYLTLDQNSMEARYEYLEGELRMLAGGSPDHSLITTNVTSLLHSFLRGGPCLVYNVDVNAPTPERAGACSESCKPVVVQPAFLTAGGRWSEGRTVA